MFAISPVKFYNPSFGIFFNNIKDDEGNLKYRGDTRICRDDLYFPEVVDFLDKKYKNVPKVNVIMHACSNGEEVYSFLGVLVSRLGEKASKFLPVSARDFDAEHLKLAKKGVYQITKSEYMLANNYMNGNFYTYFDYLPNKIIKDPLLKYTNTVKVNDMLKTLVNFQQSDILEDSKRTDFKNTILFARNFWPYLSNVQRHELARTLSKNMDSSSTLIVGDFDEEEANISALLKMYGFEETEAENVFEKPKINIYKRIFKNI